LKASCEVERDTKEELSMISDTEMPGTQTLQIPGLPKVDWTEEPEVTEKLHTENSDKVEIKDQGDTETKELGGVQELIEEFKIATRKS